ncbi:MAG: branched-chain amino acid ABC transporter permease [Rhizobiaceae bacterium]|nr:branched-chain amino acid ABC transporter permease [Rhizobiaceae bacterium]
MGIAEAIVQGVLLGGLYAIFAAGLSLVFGVMRLVNIAHGDFIVLAAYIALMVVSLTGLHPFASLLIVVPLMALIGYGLQRFVLERTLGEDLLPPILVTFGCAVIIQNALSALFSTDAQRLSAGSIETDSLQVAGLSIGVLPLLTFAIAVAIIAALEFVFFRSRIGRAFRATSDDPETAQIVGVSTKHVFGLAMALSFGVMAIAAVLLAARSSFDPFSGPARLIYGFEAVIIGGLGNLWGTLAGGIVLGIAQTLGAQISPSFQILAGHLVFFVVLALKPRGLFPRMD